MIGIFERNLLFDSIFNFIIIYILKLNSAGNFLWVRTFGAMSNEIFEKAKIDKMDNIVVTGRFVNTLDFDPSANVDIKISNGFSDIYILKLKILYFS